MEILFFVGNYFNFRRVKELQKLIIFRTFEKIYL